MTTPGDTMRERVAALRRSFDESFARPPATEPRDGEDFVAVRIAGQPYALRLSEIARLSYAPPIEPLPASGPGLLGLAGVSGAVLPVYGLASLLGHPVPDVAPRWMVVPSAEAVGLAFDGCEGHLYVTQDAIVRHADGGPAGPVRDVLHAGDLRRPVVSMDAIVTAIRTRTELSREKEP